MYRSLVPTSSLTIANGFVNKLLIRIGWYFILKYPKPDVYVDTVGFAL